MASSTVPAIGARIRAARRRRGISGRALAREIGVSASLISQIETEKSSPSVSTLYAITTALGISIEDLFGPGAQPAGRADIEDEFPAEEPGGREPVLLALGGATGLRGFAGLDLPGMVARAGAATAVMGAGAAPGPAATKRRDSQAGGDRRFGPVVRPEQREVLALDSGVTWELLGQMPDRHVDFLLITYQPGGTSSSSGLLMRHSGTEFGYVISGELTLTLGFDTHRLRSGDAVSFDSTMPHAYRNETNQSAVGIWFVLERSA